MGDEFKVWRSIVPLITVDVVDSIILTERAVELAINHSVDAQVLPLVFDRQMARFSDNKGQLSPLTRQALFPRSADSGPHRAVGTDFVAGIVNQSLNINIVDGNLHTHDQPWVQRKINYKEMRSAS